MKRFVLMLFAAALAAAFGPHRSSAADAVAASRTAAHDAAHYATHPASR